MSVVLSCECGSGEDAETLVGGCAPHRSDDGCRCRPTIPGAARHESIAGRQEICGPVLPVLERRTFDQAMEMLDGTESGLASALFSNRSDLVRRFLAEGRNGMIHVNHGTGLDSNMPVGGIRNSGFGACPVGPTAAIPAPPSIRPAWLGRH